MFGNWQKGQAGIGREYLSESRGWRVDFQIRFSDAYAILEVLNMFDSIRSHPIHLFFLNAIFLVSLAQHNHLFFQPIGPKLCNRKTML